MKKEVIKVPRGIFMLSNCPRLLGDLPVGWKVVNKKLTGCGATTYYLENEKPVILCSHRTQLLESKATSDRHIGKVHLFKQCKGKSQKDLLENMRLLREYLNRFLLTPFFQPQPLLSPKILVTVDSLPHVIDVLRDLGKLGEFMVVSDEMQCLWSDAPFKGDTVLGYIEYLKEIKDVVFLSATPYMENYLDQMDEFKDLPYYELDWESEQPERVIKPYLQLQRVNSLRVALNEVIKGYRTTGYFERVLVNGVEQRATQGVFYFNSVTDLVNAIQDNNINPGECNIICSSTNSKTVNKLKRNNFKVGIPQKEKEPHVPFTFCTKSAYEGIDMYHPNAYTYVFSNPNVENLLVDVCVDLDQILGRQRLNSNPFKNSATLFYITTDDDQDEKFQDRVKAKLEYTKEMVDLINSQSGVMKKSLITTIESSHNNIGFSNDYISVYKDSATNTIFAKNNDFVLMSEIRAWEIKKNVYSNSIQLLSSVNNSYAPVRTYPFDQLIKAIDCQGSFQDKLKVFCDFYLQYPEAKNEIENNPLFYDFLYYWNNLGPDRIKANSYQGARMDREIGVVEVEDTVRDCIYQKFQISSKWLVDDIKRELQGIYDSLGIMKKAKATDLEKYFVLRRVRLGNLFGQEIVSLL